MIEKPILPPVHEVIKQVKKVVVKPIQKVLKPLTVDVFYQRPPIADLVKKSLMRRKASGESLPRESLTRLDRTITEKTTKLIKQFNKKLAEKVRLREKDPLAYELQEIRRKINELHHRTKKLKKKNR